MSTLKNVLAVLPPLHPPLRLALRLTPEPMLAPLLAAVLTHLLRGQTLRERLPELRGKRVSLLITDLARELRFEVTASGVSSAGVAGWDVRVRGRFDDFWMLAVREEDPDTLFFQRRLTIEGDTETGLLLKNLLDGLDYDWHAHVRAVLGPLAAFLPARRRPGNH
jgi:predicted lipid carrier protein YhbT